MAQQERFQLLVVHDTREYFTRLGLYTVERDMILQFYRGESSYSSGAQLDFEAIRTEFNTLYAVEHDNVDGDTDVDSIATRTRSAKRQKKS